MDVEAAMEDERVFGVVEEQLAVEEGEQEADGRVPDLDEPVHACWDVLGHLPLVEEWALVAEWCSECRWEMRRAHEWNDEEEEG